MATGISFSNSQPNTKIGAGLSVASDGSVLNFGNQTQETPTETVRPQGAPEVQASTIGTQSDIKIPAPVVSTVAQDALGARVEPSEAMPERDTTPVEQPQRPQDALVERILGNIEEQRGKGARTNEIMEQERVGEKRRAVDSIQDEIRRKDAFYRRQQEDLDAKGGGLQSGAMAESNTISRNRNRELADLRIQEQGALGAFNTANAIAQQKVDAEFEPLQAEIESLTAVFNLMQNDLSESEKLQAQAQITSKQADKTNAQNAASRMHQMLFEAGAATPQRLKMINDGMQKAYESIARGEDPAEGIAMMQGATQGVPSLQMQQFAFQKEQFYVGLQRQALNLANTLNEVELEKDEQAKVKMDAAIGMQTLITDLINHPRRGRATGGSSIMFTLPGTKTRDFNLTHQQLKDTLTRDNLDALRGLGAMSERELALIEKSATKLSLDLPDDVYAKELQKIQDSLAPAFKDAEARGLFNVAQTGSAMGFDQTDMADFGTLGIGSGTAVQGFNPGSYYGTN